MSADLILAIDQGTTNTKAIALDRDGRVVALASAPMSVVYPRPGWAEQSAWDIWASVKSVISSVVEQVGAGAVAALAISNQRESIVVWDRATGEPIAPCIIWQCRRSAARCAALREAGHGEAVMARTGLPLDPLFPAAKIAWILDEVAGARARADKGELCAGTVDSWLLWNLTGGVHATDHSNASRTQLFNTGTLAWDEVLCGLFEVPAAMLPAPRPSDALFGPIAAGSCALPGGVPVHAMIGDSHAALFGHGIRAPGTAKATFGTGSSLMTLTPERIASRHGLSGTIAWSTSAGVAHALEGNISVSGQAAAFMAGLLGLPDAAALSRLAQTVESSDGVVFVPALVGLGAPYWRDDARGLVASLSLGSRPAHLARAALEAITLQVADVFTAMESDLGSELEAISVDGGASQNDFLMQLQADVLGRRVVRGKVAELSAVGAALLAAHGLGRPEPAAAEASAVFEPRMASEVRDVMRENWRWAVTRAL